MSPNSYIGPPLLHPDPHFTQRSLQTTPPAYDSYISLHLVLPIPTTAMSHQKRVHWDDDFRRTPSPAFSSGSRASSLGPDTPPVIPAHLPPVGIHHSPYGAHLTVPTPHMKTQPLPDVGLAYPPSPASTLSSRSSPGGFQVHSLLASSTHKYAASCPFDWDVMYDPRKTLRPTSSLGSLPGYPLPPVTLMQPATTPPLAQVTIRCAVLPFAIIVQPSKVHGNVCVTIGDVLYEVYKNLRSHVSPGEFQHTCQQRPECRQPIEQAFFARCQASPEGREEERKGLRRIDFLMGATKFQGLEVVQSDGSMLLRVR